ncbi:nuclear pore complex protein Nup50 isoform X4 [Magallana gigas]|uniref:nuclear pore complex protein Nup50 isoform X4 n=1 Tax=Magallana gigas TaxID=29159 RepID=UPI00333F5FB9
MAKRVAERELTDRNWDQEDDVEEAGTFAVATKSELQRRQIKTAKRSGASLGAGGKTSSFSGFGGFSFKPTQTSTPFSANVKSFTNGKPEKPSLSSVTEVNGTPEKKGVEKKKENDSEQATYMSSLRSLNESVLAWIKQHVEKNPYCILTPIFTDYEKHIKTIEAYKSGASQAKSQTTDNSEKKSAPALGSKETQPSLSTLFKPAPGSWTCDTCMIQNKGDISKCVACQTSKPGAGASNSQTTSAGTPDFKFGSNNVSNATTGSGFKLNTGGTTTGASSTSGFTFGSGENKSTASGFKFESNGMANNSSTTSGFTFGKSEDKSATSGFSFGKKDEKSPSSGFTFGKSEEKLPASGFVFGKKEDKPAAPGFTFGKSDDKPTNSGFTFGKSEDKSTTSGFTFGKSDDKTGSPGFSFGKKEESSTTSGFSFGKSGTTDTSSSSGLKSGSGNESSSATGFSFGTNAGTGNVPKPAFSFGLGSGTTNSDSTKGFSFAPSTSAPGSSSFGPGFFSRPAGASDAAGTQEEEEYEPPKVESTEIAEEGSQYSVKCKLFYQRDGKWNEKGVGFLHLKKPDGKAQLVVRADTNLGNILLNISLSPSIPLKRQGTNNVYMMCVPNPKISPKDEENKPVAMLVRVKNAEAADELLEKMEDLRKE